MSMTHAEFVAAYRRGGIKVEFDPRGAARFLSARLLLPFAMMPVVGVGIALALVGWFFTGLAIIAAGIIMPQLIKRSAPHFLLQQSLADERIYEELARSGVLLVTPVGEEGVVSD